MALQQTIAMLVALVSLQVLLVMLVPAEARREPLQLVCSMLPTEECAFAVDSAGKRCVLETLAGGIDWHVCQTSDIVVSEKSPKEYIETDQCARDCGVEKMTVGLSTDALESKDFTSKLCSSDCQENCPNLVDLYTNLAAGEGMSLKMICANLRHSNLRDSNLRRQRWDRPVHRRRETEVYAADEPFPAPSSGL